VELSSLRLSRATTMRLVGTTVLLCLLAHTCHAECEAEACFADGHCEDRDCKEVDPDLATRGRFESCSG